VARGFTRIFDPTDVAFGNAWFAFLNTVRGPQTDVCFRIMMEKWGREIGGLGLTLRAHCFLAVQYTFLEA